jgi:molybdopterin-guanine dinucleotide biosynthesis protein A
MSKLNGLVLAGGRSTRMGKDKAKLNWHGNEQQYHVADLLSFCCEEVFISCREDQVLNIEVNYQTIPDSFLEAGPLEAILSVFQKDETCAWMVMACDMPLMDLQTLQYLQQQRDATKIATAFQNPDDGFPEPLAAIWEAKSYDLLKLYHQKQHKSLRKILIENGAKLIEAPNHDALINANTPEDESRIREILDKKNASFSS